MLHHCDFSAVRPSRDFGPSDNSGVGSATKQRAGVSSRRFGPSVRRSAPVLRAALLYPNCHWGRKSDWGGPLRSRRWWSISLAAECSQAWGLGRRLRIRLRRRGRSGSESCESVRSGVMAEEDGRCRPLGCALSSAVPSCHRDVLE